MLKGLEISEVRLKDIGLKTSDFRIDAEYFTGKFAQYCRLIEKCGCTYFAHEAQRAVKGAFDITADKFRDTGIPFVRISNIRDMEIDTSAMVYIDADVHAEYLASELRRGDIVLSKTAYAAASIVTLPVCNTSQDTIAISLSPDSCIDPYFTVVYLNTRYGLFLMEYLFTGNVQKHFNLTECKTKLPIPIFSKKFQEEIRNQFGQALAARSESNKVYREAEQMLLAELGFASWSPTDDAVSVKSYSDFISAGRFDAEYFQPKYEAIDKKICRYRGGVVAASDALVSGLVKEDAETEERYVELADIGANGEITGCMSATFGELPSRARQRIEVGQVIASSIEGSLDKCALVTPEYGKALCSTGFHRFCSTKINSETMLLLFKSWPIQQLMKRGCSGTILCGILPGELANVPLPLVDSKVQRDLAVKVQSSFALRAESKRLLDHAKHAVEVAIEQGEEKAIGMCDPCPTQGGTAENSTEGRSRLCKGEVI